MLVRLLKIKGITVVILAGLLFLGSCRKKKPHKLEDDKAIFIGTWNWEYSLHDHNYCEGGDIVTDTLTPESEDHLFKIVFKEEGKIAYYQDDILIEENNLFFTAFQTSVVCPETNAMQFGIKYNFEGEESLFYGCIFNNTIRSGPFEEFLFPYTAGCESFSNFFVKE